MKKNKNNKKDRSLKTLFIYSFIVCLVILFSLCIKAILVINQSKFDGKNLSISKGDYYILNPGCQEKFLEITEEMELITIKIPSVQNDKIVVGD